MAATEKPVVVAKHESKLEEVAEKVLTGVEEVVLLPLAIITAPKD